MKLLLKILFSISIFINIVLIVNEIKIYKLKKYSNPIKSILGVQRINSSWNMGFSEFQTKLKENKYFDTLTKYYIVNVWNITCIPCIKEMPLLDSLSENSNKAIKYIFVSDNPEALAEKRITKLKYKFKKFVFLNDMNVFVSSVFNQLKIKHKVYPITLLLDNKGIIIYYNIGIENNISSQLHFKNIVETLDSTIPK